MLAGLISAACLGVLATGSALRPDGSGHGTHTQLGMAPCMWAIQFDAPCPTCGMTTAVARAADADFAASFRAQPFGLLLALSAATVFWAGLHVAATGSRLADMAGRLLGPRAWWLIGGSAAAAWAYKFATWPSAG